MAAKLKDPVFFDSKRLEEFLSSILLPHLFESGLVNCITGYAQWFIRSSDENKKSYTQKSKS